MRTCRTAFEGGYSTVKLYFMLGLPEETLEDVEGIAKLAQKVLDLYYETPKEKRGKSVQISVSTATFVPKPFTPFEFEPQATPEEIKEKQAVRYALALTNPIHLYWKRFLQGVTDVLVRRYTPHGKRVAILTAGTSISRLTSGRKHLRSAGLIQASMLTADVLMTR